MKEGIVQGYNKKEVDHKSTCEKKVSDEASSVDTCKEDNKQVADSNFFFRKILQPLIRFVKNSVANLFFSQFSNLLLPFNSWYSLQTQPISYHHVTYAYACVYANFYGFSSFFLGFLKSIDDDADFHNDSDEGTKSKAEVDSSKDEVA